MVPATGGQLSLTIGPLRTGVCATPGYPPAAKREGHTRTCHGTVRTFTHLGNVPTDGSFSAGGSFPSHQLGNSPIVIQSPSSGTLPRRTGQKSDFHGTQMRRGRRPRRTPRPLLARRAWRHARPPREVAQIPPTPRFAGGGVRQSPLGGTNHEHPPEFSGAPPIAFGRLPSRRRSASWSSDAPGSGALTAGGNSTRNRVTLSRWAVASSSV